MGSFLEAFTRIQQGHLIGSAFNSISLYFLQKDQDPGAFDDRFAAIVRKVYLTRYSLLPYLYTLFWWSNYAGAPVARPLMYQ